MDLLDEDKAITYTIHMDLSDEDKETRPTEHMHLLDEGDEIMDHDHTLLLHDDMETLQEVMVSYEDDYQTMRTMTNLVFYEEN